MDFEALRPVQGVCGNGQRELGEVCDDGGDSASCNFDCTAVRCGDGYINFAAGENCDDGNDEDGDACDATCSEPGNFTVVASMGPTDTEQPFHHPSVSATTYEGDPHFVLVWVEHHGGPRGLVMRLFGVNGVPVGDDHTAVSRTEGNAICSSIATNAEGRSVVTWLLEDGAGDVHAYYNVIEPDATEAGPKDVRIPNSTSPNYLACPEVAASASGGFCIVTRANDDIERTFCLDSAAETVTGAHELGTSRFGTFQKQGGIHAITGMPDGFLVTWQDLDTGHWVGQLVDTSGEPEEGAPLITIDGDYDAAWMGSGFALGQGAVVSAGLRSADTAVDLPRFAIRSLDSLRSSPPGGELAFVEQAEREEHAGRLIAHSSGRFFALWTDETEGSCDVHVLRYSSFDAPDPSLIHLAQDPQCGMHPEGAVTPDGDAIFIWPETNKALPVTEQELDLRARIIPRFLAPESS
jgi:cysteine-rich repeat protein